jgi:nitroimidazol reductase NimA-like FMN-containing flavoprotein (pyridoxamine 5'-phosphate oxidase superfamily)
MEFRPLVRKNKELPPEDCLELLRREKRGVLSVLGDGGYPYGTPMNHFYNDEDGKLYFHCGKIGHRLDALRANDKASFCCIGQGTQIPGSWALQVKSVIAFGRIEIIDDKEQVYDIAARLSRKFTDDEEYIADEIRRSGPGTLLLAMTIDHICGKIVKES